MKKKDIPWILLVCVGVVFAVIKFNDAFPESQGLPHYLTICGISLLVWAAVMLIRLVVEGTPGEKQE